MKTNFKISSLLKPLFFFITAMIATSCSSEMETAKQNRRTSSHTITFEQFKEETGISDFEKLSPTNQSTDISSRLENGDYELSDFDIKIDLIKKLTINEKETYTFLLAPKIIKDNTIFNMTFFSGKANGVSTL